MMAISRIPLTVKGQALKAKIEAGNGTVPLNLTRIVTAAGTSENPLSLDAVVDERRAFTILGRKIDSIKAIITAEVANWANPAAGIPPLEKEYHITQIGFYALDPDDGEILYRIWQLTTPILMPAASEYGRAYKVTFDFETHNASDVTITIDPSGSVTKTDIWDSVELSAADVPDIGVRTHYHIIGDVPGWTPMPSPVVPSPDPDPEPIEPEPVPEP